MTNINSINLVGVDIDLNSLNYDDKQVAFVEDLFDSPESKLSVPEKEPILTAEQVEKKLSRLRGESLFLEIRNLRDKGYKQAPTHLLPETLS